MIDREEVLRIAALARLELAQEELERMAHDLSGILEYVKQLAAIPEAAAGPDRAEPTPRREDRVVASRVVPELLENAPDRDGPLLRVPPVIE
jgi:aspartyl-tRNA(Asn)/glutamyl-tRNA(Gln) amidotransferase subunit C